MHRNLSNLIYQPIILIVLQQISEHVYLYTKHSLSHINDVISYTTDNINMSHRNTMTSVVGLTLCKLLISITKTKKNEEITYVFHFSANCYRKFILFSYMLFFLISITYLNRTFYTNELLKNSQYTRNYLLLNFKFRIL